MQNTIVTIFLLLSLCTVQILRAEGEGTEHQDGNPTIQQGLKALQETSRAQETDDQVDKLLADLLKQLSSPRKSYDEERFDSIKERYGKLTDAEKSALALEPELNALQNFVGVRQSPVWGIEEDGKVRLIYPSSKAHYAAQGTLLFDFVESALDAFASSSGKHPNDHARAKTARFDAATLVRQRVERANEAAPLPKVILPKLTTDAELKAWAGELTQTTAAMRVYTFAPTPMQPPQGAPARDEETRYNEELRALEEGMERERRQREADRSQPPPPQAPPPFVPDYRAGPTPIRSYDPFPVRVPNSVNRSRGVPSGIRQKTTPKNPRQGNPSSRG